MVMAIHNNDNSSNSNDNNGRLPIVVTRYIMLYCMISYDMRVYHNILYYIIFYDSVVYYNILQYSIS